MAVSGQKPWVLYIAQDARDASRFCPGSRQAVALVEQQELDNSVLIQNVAVLQKKDVKLPDWLTGTPSLVDTRSSLLFRGTEAVQRLKDIKSEEEEPLDDSVEDTQQPEEAVQGMIAPGQRFLVDDEGRGDTQMGIEPEPSAEGGTSRDGNVTDNDLAAYIAMRDSGPAGKLGPPQQ